MKVFGEFALPFLEKRYSKQGGRVDWSSPSFSFFARGDPDCCIIIILSLLLLLFFWNSADGFYGHENRNEPLFPSAQFRMHNEQSGCRLMETLPEMNNNEKQEIWVVMSGHLSQNMIAGRNAMYVFPRWGTSSVSFLILSGRLQPYPICPFPQSLSLSRHRQMAKKSSLVAKLLRRRRHGGSKEGSGEQPPAIRGSKTGSVRRGL